MISILYAPTYMQITSINVSPPSASPTMDTLPDTVLGALDLQHELDKWSVQLVDVVYNSLSMAVGISCGDVWAVSDCSFKSEMGTLT
jgi:hypothetical protein